MPVVVGDQGHHPGAGVRQGHDGREAHMLGPDDDRPAFQPLAAEVDALLKLAGREHAGRPVARDQPGRPRSLTAPGGEQDRRWPDFLDARRAGRRSRQCLAIGPHPGDGARGPQLRP